MTMEWFIITDETGRCVIRSASDIYDLFKQVAGPAPLTKWCAMTKAYYVVSQETGSEVAIERCRQFGIALDSPFRIDSTL